MPRDLEPDNCEIVVVKRVEKRECHMRKVTVATAVLASGGLLAGCAVGGSVWSRVLIKVTAR